MRDLVAASIFMCYVVGAWFVSRSQRARPSKRRISLFLAFTVGIGTLVGVTQQDLYPFHDWTIMAGPAPDSARARYVMAVDAAGIEWEIDHRAWDPLSVGDLSVWLFLESRYFSLDSAAQHDTAAFLLEQINAARRRALAGRNIGTVLLPHPALIVPRFWIRPSPWRDPRKVPPGPLVALRWYEEAWTPAVRASDATQFRRSLVHEFRIAP